MDLLTIIILCALPVIAVDAFFMAVLFGIVFHDIREKLRK